MYIYVHMYINICWTSSMIPHATEASSIKSKGYKFPDKQGMTPSRWTLICFRSR